MVACGQVTRRTHHGEEHLVVNRAALLSLCAHRQDALHSPTALEQLPMQRPRSHIECPWVHEHMTSRASCNHRQLRKANVVADAQPDTSEGCGQRERVRGEQKDCARVSNMDVLVPPVSVSLSCGVVHVASARRWGIITLNLIFPGMSMSKRCTLRCMVTSCPAANEYTSREPVKSYLPGRRQYRC